MMLFSEGEHNSNREISGKEHREMRNIRDNHNSKCVLMNLIPVLQQSSQRLNSQMFPLSMSSTAERELFHFFPKVLSVVLPVRGRAIYGSLPLAIADDHRMSIRQNTFGG